MTAPPIDLDESDYLAHFLSDTEPEPDYVGCGCVPVFSRAEVPHPGPASLLAPATRSLRAQGRQP
ncbi:hypothetical protein [Lentzea pudingi]|uniref:hypothetical protein n=1 Tax=Lentzea pudingi TaxID=1789439 RepID=UPI0016651A60|nr:hypothetical protein [Lentzea pudingi]